MDFPRTPLPNTMMNSASMDTTAVSQVGNVLDLGMEEGIAGSEDENAASATLPSPRHLVSAPSTVRRGEGTGILRKKETNMETLFAEVALSEKPLASPIYAHENQYPDTEKQPVTVTEEFSQLDTQNYGGIRDSASGSSCSSSIPGVEPQGTVEEECHPRIDALATALAPNTVSNAGSNLRAEWLGTSQFFISQNIDLQEKVCAHSFTSNLLFLPFSTRDTFY